MLKAIHVISWLRTKISFEILVLYMLQLSIKLAPLYDLHHKRKRPLTLNHVNGSVNNTFNLHFK